MARIRTIKPDFFRHERLYEAERETGMPLRLAFAGLWTAADREGRFRWSPRQLKLDCLPYDEIDFSRVLDALATRGFIVKYRVAGDDFGSIPSWSRHQIVNNREKASDLPQPNETNILTCEARVDDACATRNGNYQVEGKGKEGEGNPFPNGNASDLKTVVFGPCLDWLAKQTGKPRDSHRSIVGRWCRDYGDATVIEVFGAAQRQGPLEPIGWIIEALEKRKPKPKPVEQRSPLSIL